LEQMRPPPSFLAPPSSFNTRTSVLFTCHLFFYSLTRRSIHQSALRQMVYLAIKELATTAEDTIMVTSSIMKDMQPNSEVIYRPNAIRALCRIIDVRVSMMLPFYAPLAQTHRSRPWHKAWSDSSKQLSSTATHPYPPPRSCPPTICSPQ